MATPGTGETVSIGKGGSTTVTFQNVGGGPAACQVGKVSGNITVSGTCGPTIPAGGSATVTVSANPNFEGAAAIGGAVEGIGAYKLNIFVQNG